MKRIKEKLIDIYKSNYFPFILFFIIMLILHAFLNFGTDDDLFFSKILRNNNIFEWSKIRFETWTSRTVIEFFMVLILYVGYPLMKFLNVIVYTIFVYTISKLFIKGSKNEKSLNILLCLLTLVIPFTALKSAGYSATMINYLWPITFALVTFIPIKNSFIDKKNNVVIYVLSILSLIFAVNQEQVAIIVLIMDILCLIYSFVYKKKIKLYTIVSIIITIISLYIIFVVCPGNSARTISSINYWYKDYNMLNFIDKLQVSLTSMMHYLVFRANYIYIIFNVIICLLIFKKFSSLTNINILKKLVAIFPLVCSLAFSIFFGYFNGMIDLSQFVSGYIDNTFVITTYNCCNFKVYGMLFVYAAMIFCNFISIVILVDDTKEMVTNLAILLCGYLSRFSLGFSPTVFASAERTSIFLYFSFIIIIINLLKYYAEEKKEDIKIPIFVKVFMYYSILINLIYSLKR